MKLSNLYVVLFLAMTALGCSSDDDNGVEPYTLSRANFVDTYSMNSLEVEVVETITFSNGTTSTSTSTTSGTVFQNVNYTFNADGTFSASGLYTTVETIIHPDGSTETNDPVIVNLDQTGTYTLNSTSKVLTLTDQDEVQTVYDITEYTETAMRLKSESEVVSGNSTIVTTQELGFSR